MFSSQTIKSAVAYIDNDPAADDVLPVFVAPKPCRIVGAKVTVTNTVAGDGTNYFDLALLNGGSAGTATTEIGGTIGGTVGWVGLTPVAFTIDTDADNLTTGDVVTLKYNENGTGTFVAMAVQIDYVEGI